MRITKRQLQRIIREESRRLRRSRRLHEDAIDTELDNLHKNIGDDIEHIRDLKDDIHDDHEEELRAEKEKERHDESRRRRTILKRQLRRIIREEHAEDWGGNRGDLSKTDPGHLDYEGGGDGDPVDKVHTAVAAIQDLASAAGVDVQVDVADAAEGAAEEEGMVLPPMAAESRRRLKNRLRRVVRENTRPTRRRRVSRRRR
jgi:hypothetical protein